MGLARLLRDNPEGEDISVEAFEQAWSDDIDRLKSAQRELSRKYGQRAAAIVDEALTKMTAQLFEFYGDVYLRRKEPKQP